MNDKKRGENRRYFREKLAIAGFVFFEVCLLTLIFFPSIVSNAIAGVGGNVTVVTQLTIGNVPPEILNVTINDSGSGIDLAANSTVNVRVDIIARDFNNASDIQNITAEFFDSVASSWGDTDDNNTHYSNLSCTRDDSYGDQYELNATCSFDVQYYANNQTWNVTVVVNDTFNLNDTESNTTTVNVLLALGVPDIIDYGTVNTTGVSDENVTNVTNFGNVQINLTLEGYAVTEGDNRSMNCTLGSVRNISIEHEKYNLTANNSDQPINLTTMDVFFKNLTSEAVVEEFDLNYRQSEDLNEATRVTYWRIYVPTGVAGSCSGNIIFGATQAGAS